MVERGGKREFENRIGVGTLKDNIRYTRATEFFSLYRRWDLGRVLSSNKNPHVAAWVGLY